MTISERLKWLRTSNNLTQIELSEALGISRGYFSTLEKNSDAVNDRIIKLYASHCNIREEWIRTGKLPLRDVNYEIAQTVVATAYFDLAAELAPTFSTPEQLTKLLKNSHSYAQMFHYISNRFINPADANEDKRLAALFAVAFPDYQEQAEDIFSHISEEYKDQIRHPKLIKSSHLTTPLQSSHVKVQEKGRFQMNADNKESQCSLPLLGGAAAGSPIYCPADDSICIKVPDQYADQERFAMFQARGDSMEPRIHSGDAVIVQRDVPPENGEVALVRLAGLADDEYTIKRVYLSNGIMTLQSYNSAYPPMTYNVEEVRSCERVVHVLHRA